MELKDLPKRWTHKLKCYLADRGISRDHLETTDFYAGKGIILRFEDGSSAFFDYAFCLEDTEFGEIAVFTEHCGYHIFPLLGTQIDLVETTPGNQWLTEYFQMIDKVQATSASERWSRCDLYRY